MKLFIGMMFLVMTNGAFAAPICGASTLSDCTVDTCKPASVLKWENGKCQTVAATEKPSPEGCGPITGGNPDPKVVPTTDTDTDKPAAASHK